MESRARLSDAVLAGGAPVDPVADVVARACGPQVALKGTQFDDCPVPDASALYWMSVSALTLKVCL
jgi:hypothetical protein